MTKLVMGVDGCRCGWIAVVCPVDAPWQAKVRATTTFTELLACEPQAAVIAIDIPIGLPRVGGRGGRRCDIEARANLGNRQSSVFAVPARVAVMERDYRTACAVAQAHSDPPLKVSKQTFNLFAKIREVDAVVFPELQERIVECHPELAFWALNGERPLEVPKKVKSRPYPAGLETRRALLASAGFTSELLTHTPIQPGQWGADDLLDATVCAWSAARIARGRGRRFPEAPDVDARGLRMEIWC